MEVIGFVAAAFIGVSLGVLTKLVREETRE